MTIQPKKATGGKNYLVRYQHRSRDESRDIVISISGAISKQEAEARAEGALIHTHRARRNDFFAPEARLLPKGVTTKQVEALAKAMDAFEREM